MNAHVTAVHDRRLNETVGCSRPIAPQDIPSAVCFPTGRPERRMPSRSTGRTPSRRGAADPDRGRRWAGALAVGGTLAGMVWVMILVGTGYQDSVAPQTPDATQVVYVRAGESLSALAERIAPGLPTAGIVEQLRALNGLRTAGLAVGQALLAPRYR